MANSAGYLAHLRDQFAAFGPIEVKRMFGGAGIFHGGLMIALVSDDTLYFKTDDRNRADFERAGLGPFTFGSRAGRVLTSYYEAPSELLEDGELLASWAGKARDAAVAARAKKARAPARPKPPAAPRKRR